MTDFSRDLSDSNGEWRVRERAITLGVNGVWTQVALADPLRWAIIFAQTQTAGAAYAVSTNPTNAPLSAAGILVSAGLAPLMFSYTTFGGLVQQAWYAAGGGMFQPNLTVIEVWAQQ